MTPSIIPSRALGAAGLLGLTLVFGSPAGQAAPAADAPATVAAPPAVNMAPPAVNMAPPAPAVLAPAGGNAAPRALLASPLVTIERIDGAAAGVLGMPGAAAAGGQAPIYLLDPDGFTTFGQVAPPDGGHLIMLVE